MVALPNRCRVKWSIDAGEEHLVADGGVELLEDARALGVGDPVEVLERRGRVDGAVAGDRVRARALVGVEPPLAAGVGVVTHASSYSVTSAVTRLPMYSAKDSLSQRSSHHFGVTMLPNHWCAISCATVVARWIRHAPGDPAGEDQRVAEGDAARVLHRAGVELRDEGLVVVAERVADPEQPVELVEALPGDREQLVGVRVEVGGDARRARSARAGCRRARRGPGGRARRRG